MYTFIDCVVFLVVVYFIYGKIVEKVFGIDESVETLLLNIMMVKIIFQ